MTATFDGETDTVIFDDYNRKRPVARSFNPYVKPKWFETAGQPFLTVRQWDALDAIRAAHPAVTVAGERVTIPHHAASGFITHVGGYDLPVLSVNDGGTVVDLSEV